MLPFLLLGCQAPETEPGTCDNSAEPVVAVMTAMSFSRAEDGISAGFDLDDENTDEGDSRGCGIGDYVDDEGNPGIDNAFARLLPALDATEAVAVEGLIQAAIDSGELLLMFEIRDLDDVENDTCVALSVQEGAGEPLLGTDGAILPDQTFSRDPESFTSSVTGMQMADGRLDAGPFTMELPANILGVEILVSIHTARIRIEPQEDGSYSGFIAGGTAIDYIIEIANEENVDDTLTTLLESLLTITADLGEGCDQISMTIDFEAVPAYFID